MAAIVREQLAVVIVFLLVDAQQGEHDSVVAGGLEVVYAPACFSGKADIVGNVGQ